MIGYYEPESYETTQETLLARMGIGSTLTDFFENGEVVITSGPDKIKDAIYDILSTPYGTRFFLPNYGCRVKECLFEPNDSVARDLAEYYVKDSLTQWEPRIDIISVTAESDQNTMSINVIYNIKSLGMTDSYVYTMEKRVPELE